MGHLLIENRHGLIVDTRTTHATGRAERETAEARIAAAPRAPLQPGGRQSLWWRRARRPPARALGVTSHGAQNTAGRRSAIDGRTTRHPGYALSQRLRKRIEEPFGWVKAAAGLRKARHRGLARVGWIDGRRLQSGPVAQADRRRDMTTRAGKSLLGKWRITDMELWDTEYIDMLGSAYVQFDEGGRQMTFGAEQIGLDCEYGQSRIWFTFHGFDEITEGTGDGEAELEDDGTLTGEIRFNHGDETSFTAKKWW
jgi:hypothetical protein